MHERTGRALARLLFLSCCALPTAVTVGLILITWTPWYHRRCLASLEKTLYRETGLRIELADFRQLSPSRLRLDGLRALEPETGREVARVRVLWWVSDHDRAVIRMSQPELQAEQLPFAWKLVHDRFLCRPDLVAVDTRFSASDVTVHGRGTALTLRDFDAWIRPLAQAIELHAECRTADAAPEAEPLQIDLLRDRSGTRPSTRVRLRANDAPLPVDTLADYLPAFARLGPRATFNGSLLWQLTGDQWSVDLSGTRFADVDLSWLTESIPHRLTGQAEIVFQRGRWKPGETVDVSGELRASRGYISHSLLAAARDHLRFQTAAPRDQQTDQAYDELAIHFDLFGSELQIDGFCGRLDGYGHLPPDTALCVGGRSLAISSPDRLPSLNLSLALAPAYSDLVPLSGQTHWLLGLLLPAKSHRTATPPGPGASDHDVVPATAIAPRLGLAPRSLSAPRPLSAPRTGIAGDPDAEQPAGDRTRIAQP